jgi:hypothetical protein
VPGRRTWASASRCFVDYLETTYRERPLFPPGAFARAKVVELLQVIELYLELVARRLLPTYFAKKAFGACERGEEGPGKGDSRPAEARQFR